MKYIEFKKIKVGTVFMACGWLWKKVNFGQSVRPGFSGAKNSIPEKFYQSEVVKIFEVQPKEVTKR